MTIDIIHGGMSSNADIGERLMAANFDSGALRPFIGTDGRSYITVNGKTVVHNAPATLRRDAWIEMDKKIVMAAKPRLKAVTDLRSAGLVHSLAGGMGTTIFETETMSRAGAASISMDGIRIGDTDRPVHQTNFLPLPIVHEDFDFSLRQIMASRRSGTALDLSMAEEAARNVAEEVEGLVIGLKSTSYGGAFVYGMINSPARLTASITDPTGTWTPDVLINEILAMKTLSQTNSHFGPWRLYTGLAWEQYLDADYSASKGDNTLRDRVKKIEGISSLSTLDYLSGFDVILVQQTSNVMRLVVGMEMTTLQWDSHGGLRKNFKIMTIMVPQVRGDHYGKTGLVHGSV